MRLCSLFIACPALVLTICASPSFSHQATAAEAPDEAQANVRPAGTLVRPEGGVQHPDLDKAWSKYGAAAASASSRVRTEIVRQLDSAAAEGDLDAAEQWQAALRAFDSTGELTPEAKTERTLTDAANGLIRVKDELAEAYEAVVRALTREKKIIEAKAVRGEARAVIKSSSPASSGDLSLTNRAGVSKGDPLAACDEAIRQKRLAIQSQYVGELEAMEKSLQAKGALEDVFAAKAERTRFIETKLLAYENFVEKPDALRELQQEYLELQQNVTASVAEELVEKLEQQTQSLTIDGKLEEALEARNSCDEIRRRYLDSTVDGRGWRDITSTMMGGERKNGLCVLRKDQLVSRQRYTPPIEIEYLCETARYNIRLGFACSTPVLANGVGEIILGWEVNPNELRIDGGPARGRHVANAGFVPAGKMVNIRQLVLPGEMRITVDGKSRAVWHADFSGVDDHISLRHAGSDVRVKRIRIRKPK